MLGDSDEDLLPEEDEDGEDDSSQVTSQELRRLRMLERQRRLAQNPGEYPLQEEDMPPAFDSRLGLPLSPIPPWPTPRAADSPGIETEKTYPLSNRLQPMASLPPTVPAAPVRRHTTPFAAPQDQQLVAGPSRQAAASPVFLPGWRSFRRHSCWLIPLLLVVAFFLLILVIHSRQAGAMLFIFAAIGVLQSAILLYAPNDAFWAVGVVGGFLVFLAAAFFALFLPIFALILSILLLSLGVVALRERYYPVKEGTVAVMGLFGRHNRTLQPGFNLRAPGEKALGVVETQRIRYETRIPPITLFSGEQVTMSVAMTYQVVPGEEHLAIRTTKEWQRPIQQQLQSVVQDVVSGLSIDDFRHPGGAHPASGAYAVDESDDDQPASPLERINERLTDAMREQVADRGVAVHAVRVHTLEGSHLPGAAHAAGHPASSHPTTALPAVPQNAGQDSLSAMPGAPVVGAPSYPAAPAGLTGPPGPPIYPPGSIAAPPPAGAAALSGGTPLEAMTLLSAQALAETYDAVVRQRITDLATIRRIISQFEAVAADPELSQQVPFDAAAGAHNLITHLHNLQARSVSMSAQQSDGSAFSPSTSPAAPLLPEED
ncbi:MAG TPA: SPFH domain-containing protein [Ktedonobacterales bacterium]|jgi:hypothetical protein